jgi:protein-tyrosine phosphatase
MHAETEGMERGRRPGPQIYRRNYQALLPQAANVVVEVIDLLAGGNATPILICCSVGKDRTGVVCALLLRALGVRLSDIGRDYALTARAFRRLQPDERGGWTSGLSAAELAIRTQTVPGTIISIVSDLEREHGRVARYLELFGLTPAALTVAGKKACLGRA